MKKNTLLNLFILAFLLAFSVPALVQAFGKNAPESLALTQPVDLFAQASELESVNTPAPTPEESDEVDFPAVASIIANNLQHIHLLRFDFSPERSAMAWTNYLAALDGDRMYFRQEDLTSLDAHRLNLRQEMTEGNLSFAHEAFDLFMKRVHERIAYVDTLLQKPFDFSIDESYTWRRRDAPWPASLEEQDDLWRRRIKNELLLRTLNQQLDDEEAAQQKPAPTPANAFESSPASAGESSAESTEPTAESTEPTAEPSPPTPPETPAEFLRKRYQKYLTFFEDSDAEYTVTLFISSVCSAYDPHTDYFSPVKQEDFDIGMQLSLQGIGATLQSEDGTAKITEIIPGGPADRDTRDIRLVPGDRIIAVAQEGDAEFTDILHWPLYKAVRLIRGPKGTRVRLTVQNASDPSHTKTRIVELVRDEVKLEEQAATSTLETFSDSSGRQRRMGVISLPSFYASSGDTKTGVSARSATADIARLIGELNSQGIEGLILDLRNNGGGALQEAVRLAGLFIRTGPVVQVQERNRTTPLKDFDPSVAFQGPLVILINRLSASASEIVAGALQDYGRAIVVGDSRSHGKGSVQQIIPLNADGSLGSIKVTNAGFFRITGDSTQIKGVESDILLPSVFDTYSELGEDKLPNAIPWKKIGGTFFRRSAALGPTIEALRTQSTTRLASNDRWQKHLSRIGALKRFNDAESVPLEQSKRLAILREEREIFREIDDDPLAESADTDTHSSTPEKPKTRAERAAERRARDVVLDEALQILADFTDAQAALPPEAPAATTPIAIPDVFKQFF